jgi:putative NADH-flavin reductase
MKIAVIAASGKSGSAFVSAALAAGHQVTAGIHRTNSLPAHPNLTVVSCNATNPDDLRKLLAGQEVVTSFIGHVHGSRADVQSTAIQQIVAVMNEFNIRRLTSLTGTGVRFPGDVIATLDRFLNTSIRLIDPARIRDGEEHVELLKKSGLDWTIIRVLKLTNGQAHPFSLTEHGPAKVFVSRSEVALATLQVLEQHSFIQKAPTINKPRHA